MAKKSIDNKWNRYLSIGLFMKVKELYTYKPKKRQFVYLSAIFAKLFIYNGLQGYFEVVYL